MNKQTNPITASEISEHIEKAYSSRYGFLVIPEMTIGDRRIDVFAINWSPSQCARRIAFEIKITKADFVKEVNNPSKRKSFLQLAGEFYFVVPKGLIDKKSVPMDCGLIEVDRDKWGFLRHRTTIKAMQFNYLPNWFLITQLLKRVQDKYCMDEEKRGYPKGFDCNLLQEED